MICKFWCRQERSAMIFMREKCSLSSSFSIPPLFDLPLIFYSDRLRPGHFVRSTTIPILIFRLLVSSPLHCSLIDARYMAMNSAALPYTQAKYTQLRNFEIALLSLFICLNLSCNLRLFELIFPVLLIRFQPILGARAWRLIPSSI